jgi:hypothetical protein
MCGVLFLVGFSSRGNRLRDDSVPQGHSVKGSKLSCRFPLLLPVFKLSYIINITSLVVGVGLKEEKFHTRMIPSRGKCVVKKEIH